MNNAELIDWLPDPGDFTGEIGASLSVGGERWRELGAAFVEAGNGNGESPGLATGGAQTSLGTLRFGVLDYGEEITYLLVPSVDERAQMTKAVLAAFEAAGMLSLDRDVLDDTSGPASEPPLDDRIDSLEGMLVDLWSAMARPTPAIIPEARVVSLLPERSHRTEPGRERARLVREMLREEAAPDSMQVVLMTGVVRRSNEEGFGLFRADDDDEDLLLHFTGDWNAVDVPASPRPDYELRLGDGTRVSVEVKVPAKEED